MVGDMPCQKVCQEQGTLVWVKGDWAETGQVLRGKMAFKHKVQGHRI